MAGPSIDIRSLLTNDTTGLESKLVDILDPAVNGSSGSSSAASSAESAAGEIDKLFPGQAEAEEFLWILWTFFLKVAKKIPADDARQQLLLSALENLKAKPRERVELWGNSASVWADLPLLGPCAREAWSSSPRFDGSDQDATVIAEWISLNAFAARVVGASIQPWTNFGLWELRHALERPLESPSARDTHLTTAAGWIVHAGKVFYEEGRKEAQLDEADARALSPGKLFEGKPGFSEERWKFWRTRLEELSAETGSEEVKKKTEKALEAMQSVEG